MPRPKSTTTTPPEPPAVPPERNGTDWFDVNELARRLHCATGTVRRRVREGDVPPPHRFGPGMTRWSEIEYAKWQADLFAKRR